MKTSRILLGCILGLLGFLGNGAGAQIVTQFSAGITAGAAPCRHRRRPRWQHVVHGKKYRPDRADYPAGVVTEFSAGITAGAAPTGIAAGPDGNLWFAEYAATGSGGLPRRRRHRVQRRHHRRRTGHHGRPRWNLWFTEMVSTDRADHPGRRGHRVQRRHHAPVRSRRHHGRPRWQPVVHGKSWQPDRADYPAGLVTEFTIGLPPSAGPTSTSQADPMATCGSRKFAANQIGPPRFFGPDLK